MAAHAEKSCVHMNREKIWSRKKAQWHAVGQRAMDVGTKIREDAVDRYETLLNATHSNVDQLVSEPISIDSDLFELKIIIIITHSIMRGEQSPNTMPLNIEHDSFLHLL